MGPNFDCTIRGESGCEDVVFINGVSLKLHGWVDTFECRVTDLLWGVQSPDI